MQMCSSISLENLAIQVTNPSRVWLVFFQTLHEFKWWKKCHLFGLIRWKAPWQQEKQLWEGHRGQVHHRGAKLGKSEEGHHWPQQQRLLRWMVCGQGEDGITSGTTAPCVWSREVLNSHSCATLFISGSATVLKTSEMVVGAHTHKHTHIQYMLSFYPLCKVKPCPFKGLPYM